MMAAGLQGDIDGGSGRGFCAGGQGVPLGVGATVLLVIALPNDGSVLYDDGPDEGIGIHSAHSV